MVCVVPHASCIRHSAVSRANMGAAAPDSMTPSPSISPEIASRAFKLMKSQLAEWKQQRIMEEAVVSLLSVAEPQPGVFTQLAAGHAHTPEKASSGERKHTDVDLGSLLVGSTDSGVKSRPAAPGAYSFMNWGQIGGMMQSPMLAHTGMPVYMPRQAAGTTVGLDFDSPATFHGPLLVLMMVCILIFFLVLMLCCWMVKSKQKHDKFMAEKVSGGA